jgi:hypothetical protein
MSLKHRFMLMVLLISALKIFIYFLLSETRKDLISSIWCNSVYSISTIFTDKIVFRNFILIWEAPTQVVLIFYFLIIKWSHDEVLWSIWDFILSCGKDLTAATSKACLFYCTLIQIIIYILKLSSFWLIKTFNKLVIALSMREFLVFW